MGMKVYVQLLFLELRQAQAPGRKNNKTTVGICSQLRIATPSCCSFVSCWRTSSAVAGRMPGTGAAAGDAAKGETGETGAQIDMFFWGFRMGLSVALGYKHGTHKHQHDMST